MSSLKRGINLPTRDTKGPYRRGWRSVAAFGLGLLTIALLADRFTGLPRPFPHPRGEDIGKDQHSWSWGDVQPRRELTWESCYDEGHDCARLDVPMDWIDPTDAQRVVLAVIRIRATDKSDYKGPVFFNPGGPGGSGVAAMRDRGAQLQAIIGKNYDLISWDPRGVGASIPRVSCWNSPEQDRLWALQDVGVVGSHPGVVYDAYARAMAFSQSCEQAMNASGLLQHISTPSHARDLLELVKQTGNEKLKYWGFSYGTLLGGTFAALYPDRVARLVSDGLFPSASRRCQPHAYPCPKEMSTTENGMAKSMSTFCGIPTK